MTRFFYSALFYLLTPVILLRLRLKSRGVPGYGRRTSERFGRYSPDIPKPASPVIWVHAVSVGEVEASAPLVKALLEAQPDCQLLVTTMTPTGSERVRSVFGESVLHVYAPYDQPAAIRRFLARYTPRLLIIMETELWPNMIHYAKKSGARIMLANGRLSARSAGGYARFRGMTRQVLKAIDCICMQGLHDSERIIELGAEQSRVRVTGSLKFHAAARQQGEVEGEPFTSIKASGRTVIIAASTRENEEAKVLQAYAGMSSESTLLLLVPRHPERFAEVIQLCKAEGFSTQTRSSGESIHSGTAIVVGDSMGEMQQYYGVSHIAFVGGSLVDTGCQNVLEPAAFQLPVVTGPSQFNFLEICRALEEAGALRTVPDSAGLASVLGQLVADPSLRQAMGLAGSRLIAENQQALPATLEVAQSLLAVSTYGS